MNKLLVATMLCLYTQSAVAQSENPPLLQGDSRTSLETQSSDNDWLSEFGYQGGAIRALGSSSKSGSGVVAGCKTSTAGANCIGITSWAFNDNLSNGFTNWALYAENRVFANSSSGITAEFNITSWNRNGDIDVYGRSEPNGVLAVALQLASGGTCGISSGANAADYRCYNPSTKAADLGRANPTSSALQISNNGAPFYNGITFTHDALYGGDGIAGLGTAIQMAKGHMLVWRYCDNLNRYPSKCRPKTSGTKLYSTVSNEAKATNLISSDHGLVLSNGIDAWMLNVPVDKSFVNGFRLLGGASSKVQIQAIGQDDNIDIDLHPKGKGAVNLVGRQISEKCEPTGSISIKVNGEARRLAIC